jgi:hypothetical protein
MRHGVLTVGVGSDSLLRDLRRLPAFMLGLDARYNRPTQPNSLTKRRKSRH